MTLEEVQALAFQSDLAAQAATYDLILGFTHRSCCFCDQVFPSSRAALPALP